MAAVSSLAGSGGAYDQDLPKTVGACVRTSITIVGPRLKGDPRSGSFVQYANRGIGISQDVIEALLNSRAGDPVQLCLTSIPQACPPGDDRGRVYSATNLRTQAKWELPDAEYRCGGP